MPELKPCPYCGSQKLTIEDNRNGFWTECYLCGLSGPIETSVEECREAWNSLPSHPEPQPIETAPKDGVWILVSYQSHLEWMPARHVDNVGFFYITGIKVPEATHWLPMPPLPKDGGGQQPSKCSRCNGSGYWIETKTSGSIPFDAERGDCARCGGSGLEPKGGGGKASLCPICKYRNRASEFGLCSQCQEGMDAESGMNG